MRTIFNHDEDLMTTACFLVDKQGRAFSGFAKCEPEDKDFYSRLTGETIAHLKASIEAEKSYRNELKNELKVLKNYHSNIVNAKWYNRQNPMAKHLYKTIMDLEDEINASKDYAEKMKNELKTFIDNKEKFYDMVRRNRRLEAAILKMEEAEESGDDKAMIDASVEYFNILKENFEK